MLVISQTNDLFPQFELIIRNEGNHF